MSQAHGPIDESLNVLRERALELKCLYVVENVLEDPAAAPEEVLRSVVRAIPLAWRHPESCQARITLGTLTFDSPGFQASACLFRADMIMREKPIGTVEISYHPQTPSSRERSLPPEKRQLIDTIAKRLTQFASLRRLLRLVELRNLANMKGEGSDEKGSPRESPIPAEDEDPYGGLCMTCIHSPTCTFPCRKDQPVLSCEEFDDRGTDATQAHGIAPLPTPEPKMPPIKVIPESSQPRGLCATCAHRDTCRLPKPAGGVSHCEEFA